MVTSDTKLWDRLIGTKIHAIRNLVKSNTDHYFVDGAFETSDSYSTGGIDVKLNDNRHRYMIVCTHFQILGKPSMSAEYIPSTGKVKIYNSSGELANNSTTIRGVKWRAEVYAR